MKKDFDKFVKNYLQNLEDVFNEENISTIYELAKELKDCWQAGRSVYICGNGGSAGNAMHIANDFHYGVGCNNHFPRKKGIKFNALPSNPSIITCLANDIGYENIYSNQLNVHGNPDDILIVLSGSGNSQNIINALIEGNSLGMKTFAVLAFDGGKCIKLASKSIYFKINDMQIAEDTQLIVFHMCMQWLSNHLNFQNN